MKRIKIFVFLLLLFIFQCIDLTAQWTHSEGLEGAHAWDITLHNDSLLFITTENGIFGRTLANDHWELINEFGCSYIMSNGSYLYSGGPMCGLSRSADNGATWEDFDEIYNASSWDLSGSVLIVCTGEGTYRSDNNGDSWDQLGPLQNSDDCDIYICDSIVLLNDMDMDTLWISYDLGISFSGLTLNGANNGYIYDLFVDGIDIYMAQSKGVYYFNEQDSAWSILGDSIQTNAHIRSVFKYDDTLRYISIFGYYSFITEDSSWLANNTGLENIHLSSIDFSDSVLYTGTQKGPFYKKNDTPWLADYNGLYQRSVYQVVQEDSILFALTEDGIFYSVDNGGSFEIYPALNYPLGTEMIIKDSVFYLATSQGFAVSKDDGYSWGFYNEGLPEYRAIDCIAISDRFIYAGWTSGLYRSSIDTIEWVEIFDANIRNLKARDSSIIVSLGYGDEGLFRSGDYGMTFHAVSLPEIGVPDPIVFLGETNEKVFALDNEPYYSEDWGITWSYYTFENLIPNLFCIAESEGVTIVSGGQIYDPQCIYMSDDHGNTWNDISGGLPLKNPYPSIWQVYISDGRIITHPHYNSLWYRDDLITSIHDKIQFELIDLDIFPNPCYDLLNLCLPEPGTQSFQLSIFDITGRSIYREFYTQQTSILQINTSGFPPGFYLLTIQSPEKIYSTKLIKK